MRKMIAAAALLAVSSAYAAEELKFGDVNYFLKQGQFNLVADLTQTFNKSTFQGDTVETRGPVLSTSLAYAFNDQLNAFVGLAYAYDLQTEDKTAPRLDNYNNDGLANPIVGVNYRLMNQNTSMYNVDFGAVASFGIEDAERGSNPNKDGNFANGRNSLELNARMGRKWNEANEWQLAVGGIYNMSGEYTTNAVGGDVDTDQDSSFDLFARATYQYRPVNEFMMLVSLQATRVGEADEESNNVDATADAHTDLDFRFTAKYLITDTFIAKFNYGISRNAEYDIETAGTTDELKKRRENFFGLGVDFLF